MLITAGMCRVAMHGHRKLPWRRFREAFLKWVNDLHPGDWQRNLDYIKVAGGAGMNWSRRGRPVAVDNIFLA